MPSITVRETGLVYRNPMPNVWSRQAYFPSVAQLDDGLLVVTMDVGSAMEAFDVRSFAVRSADGGRTWSAPAPLPVPEASTVPHSTTGRTMRAADGSLVSLLTYFNRSRAKHGLANPDTDGFVETDFLLTRSRDGGHTWSKPRWIQPPIDWDRFESCSPVVEAGNNRCLIPTSLWRDWNGECPPGMKAVVFCSDDGCKTWPRGSVVMDGWAQGIAHWEQKLVVLSDGRLLALCWTYDLNAHRSLRNRYALSADRGDTFSAPVEAPLDGETCTPYALDGNRILCVYRRTDKRGLWAHLARLEGDVWTPLADAPLWGTERAAYTREGESAFDQMSTLQFGYPQTVRLQDGQFFVVFWCVEQCVAGIRWFRLSVED